jgi:hypothetical protein
MSTNSANLIGLSARPDVAVSATSLAGWLAWLADGLIAVMLLSTVLPETLTEDVYVGDVPLRFVLLYLALAGTLVASLAARQRRLPLRIAAAAVAFLYMAALGIWRGNDLKYWTIDVSNFCGLLLGLQWAYQRGPWRGGDALRFWGRLVALVLLLNLVGLCVGLISPAGAGVRRYSVSLFASTAFITIIFPFWITSASTPRCGGTLRSEQFYAVAAMGLVLLAALMSGTRSMFLTWTCSVMLTVWLSLQGRNAVVWLLMTATVCSAIFAMLFVNQDWRSGILAERLLSTDVAEDYRYQEVAMMFDELRGDIFRGEGFGSRFESCIGRRNEMLAFAPHVAILTLWFKGGLLIFLATAILPAVRGIYQLTMTPITPLAAACWGGVLLYLVQASMAGGWNFHALFLFGAFLSLAINLTRRPARCGFSRF